MKKSLKFLQCFLSIGCLLLLSTAFSQEEMGGNREQAIKSNKENIHKLFDSIASSSFEKLRSDSERLNVPKNFDFKNKSLNSIKKQLDSLKTSSAEYKGIKPATEYAQAFVKQRDSMLSVQAIFLDQEKFNLATNSIVSTNSYFGKNIIKGKDYPDLVQNVKSLISAAQNNFIPLSVQEISTASEQILVSKKNVSQPLNSGFSLNLLSWILITLLLLSIVFNILQARKNEKLIKELARQKPMAKVESSPAPSFQTRPPTPQKITSSKLNSLLDKAYGEMLSFLNSEYSAACVALANVEEYKNNLKGELTNKNFIKEVEAKNYIDKQIDLVKQKIEAHIDDCRDRQTAEAIIDNEINISQFRSSKLEESEIQGIVERHKQNLKGVLSTTVDARELETKIEQAKEAIRHQITKTIQQNSEFFLPFFDTDGTIADSKKSKTRKRDSVVKLVIDSDDTTRASYTLLYDDAVLMKSGIQSYQGLLLPVSKIEGNVDPNANSVAQVGEDGTLVLSNGYWKVDKKVTVKII